MRINDKWAISGAFQLIFLLFRGLLVYCKGYNGRVLLPSVLLGTVELFLAGKGLGSAHQFHKASLPE